MAGGITVFVCSLVLLCSLTQGQDCPPTINQTLTGKRIGSKPVWNVIIKNTCDCTDLDVTLSAPNFQTLIPVDPSILSKDNTGHWLVNDGKPIYKGNNVTFTYAWDRVDFSVFDYRVACS
ncbi:hypothetical protein DH2020_047937 [Rehmannia glutinosa]|uniref:Uncharacterized protein n=1 Tax=Rehmannia glutinosa TaxID=99300 RepID=A0ABR0U7U5_REHGL